MQSNEFSTWRPLPAPPMKERPVCPNCKKPLKIQKGFQVVGSKEAGKMLAPTGNWQYVSYGHFCTQTCGVNWANKIFNAIDAGTHKLVLADKAQHLASYS